MKWEDKGILIAISKFGETDQIATFITKNHGLAKGLIKGGISKKQKPYLIIGNEFEIIWKSRLEDGLGFFSFNPIKIYGLSMFGNKTKLEILSSSSNILYDCLSEHHPYPQIFKNTYNLIHNIETTEDENTMLINYMLWEKDLLKEIGFELTLNKCNATGTTKELCYISPKTGAAICETAGRPYHTKLLLMPKMWKNDFDINSIKKENITEALKILEYFFEKHIYSEKNKSIPYTRRILSK